MSTAAPSAQPHSLTLPTQAAPQRRPATRRHPGRRPSSIAWAGLLATGLGLAFCGLPARAQSADPATIDVQMGVERSSYEDRLDGRTDLTQLPWLLRYRQGRLLLQAQMAWVSWERKATGGAAAAPVDPAAEPVLNTAQGWGDSWVKASWELVEVSRERTGWDLTLKLKGNNGDTHRNLGTGRRDLALQLEAMHLLDRQVTAFGHLGLRASGSSRRIGDAASQTDTSGRRERAYAEFGLQRSGPPGWVSGLSYDAQQASGSLGPVHELMAYTALTTGATRWELHAAKGFTEASARFQIGLAVRNRF